jgi:uncharacterized membrane protein
MLTDLVRVIRLRPGHPWVAVLLARFAAGDLPRRSGLRRFLGERRIRRRCREEFDELLVCRFGHKNIILQPLS